MNDNQATVLQVFVEGGCDTCKRALSLAEEVEHDYPRLAVEIIDVGETPNPRDDVFAVPTFVLNNKVLSLGNPYRTDLRDKIETLLRGLV